MLSDDLVGYHFRYPDHYEVEREKIREFAAAVKATDAPFHDDDAAVGLGFPGLLAPPTFASMLGYLAQTGMFDAAGIALTDAQIVQVDQEFKYLRPIHVGDSLYADVTVQSIRHAHGTDLIVLKTVITVGDGAAVQETYTTLAGRSEENGESGFSDGTA